LPGKIGQERTLGETPGLPAIPPHLPPQAAYA